jgi:hypothetical protein
VIPRDRLILAEASQRPTTDSRNSSLHEANAFLDNADNVERALRAQDTSRAILDAIHSLGALSGKKILMVLTGDLPLDEAVTNFEEMEVTASRAKYRAGDSQRAKVLALLRDRMVAEANAAGVTIFVVNPEGLTVPGFNAGSATQLAVQSFGNSAPVWLSLQTGGQYFPGNSVALSLKQFDERSGNFYSLGYRPSAKSGYHKIAVHIRRAGRYTILARDGYALIDSGVALERALQSGVGVASHPVSLPIAVSSADPRSAGKGNSTVPLAARVALKDIQFVPRAGGSIGRLHVYISIFDDRGRNVGFHHLLRDIKSDDSADGDYTFSTNLLLPAGHYQIAVAMRDEVSDSVGIGVVRISV